MKLKLFIFLIMTIFTNELYAYCSEPRTPYHKPTKPSVPLCVNELFKTHTCDSWTINSYNSSIRNYNYEVDTYIDELNRYVRAASDYAKCEASNLR